jgi:N6-L-threonylcarbamoyladenine synthase
VLKKTLKTIRLEDIDAIAVTTGPGLIGSLLVGIESAKTIAMISGKPIIPVHHIFAHLYANWLDVKKIPEFPLIALIVSGGHTELFLLKSHQEITWLGGTRDDAAGEAFDKTARLLGLGYPGGPAVAAHAAKFKDQKSKIRVQLPRPMMHKDTLDFSFAGLKTAVLREVIKLKNENQLNSEAIEQLSFELQESITDVLVHKTMQAAQEHKVKSIVVGGGVAANKRLTEKFQIKIKNLKLKINLHIPPPNLCTDNAAYIASFAYFHNQPIPWQDIQARPDLTVEV